MSKESYLGIAVLGVLLIGVPLMFLLMQAGAGLLYLIFTKPAYILTFIGGAFLGGFLNSKLK